MSDSSKGGGAVGLATLFHLNFTIYFRERPYFSTKGFYLIAQSHVAAMSCLGHWDGRDFEHIRHMGWMRAIDGRIEERDEQWQVCGIVASQLLQT